VLADLVRVGREGPVRAGDEDGADLVLDHTAGVDGAVTEVGQQQTQVAHLHSELLADAPTHGVLDRLAGPGVPAARVGPDAGPGPLRERPAGQEHPAGVVEQVHRERLVQRRVGAVHVEARRRAGGCAVVVQQDDQVLLALDRGHRGAASVPWVPSILSDTPPVRPATGPPDTR
jgi:hypothetical protein